ncbi:MAG: hypothetical protein OZSIB_2241 [Candidatus Ozemobacter sibiricus]|uniref:B12-binding domain-containing protein n=1 Tax=Candidatus Ozemobacter sibiricus TaxID=2268124 RepID=A0A367ZVI9_9BACT|nr:MAG: hypothetical protein OZSIB_2241 [Candidatus Ozemobacter sibiricus]
MINQGKDVPTPLGGWPKIPPEAAASYEAAQDRLISEVEAAIGTDPRLTEVWGQPRLRELLHLNHQNHARFMATVFQLGAYQMLERVLPWAYRAYSHRGVPFAYFEVALPAWRQAVTRHLPIDHQPDILAVYDWMIAQHEALVAEARRPLPPRRSSGAHQVFLTTLRAGDFRGALALARQRVTKPDDLAPFFQDVIRPAMVEIGLLWESGELSVAQEHLLTAQVTMILSHLYCTALQAPRTRGKAVVSAAPNEFHELGALMVAQALEADGWSVIFTGANTPLHDLRELVRREKPIFLAISVTMPYHLPAVRDFIVSCRADEELRPLRIMVGGQAVTLAPDLLRLLQADGTADSCVEAVQLARNWECQRNQRG